MKPLRSSRPRAYTLPEILAAISLMTVVSAVIGTALMTIRKSAEATNHYILETNNANRLVDYVARDLSRAVRVGQVAAGAYSTLRNVSNFSVTETNTLVVHIPDFYASNTPDNTPGSPFKTSRYARAKLGKKTYVDWEDAVMPLNGKQVARFAPKASASDEIQVRYYRATRSPQDPTVCYFRREYTAAGVPLAPAVEIAEQGVFNGAMTSLTITGLSNGTLFRLQSAFAARFSSSGNRTTATNQLLEVRLLNPRRD